MNKGYIYKIVCLVNQKVYIGQTIKNIGVRFKEHLKDSERFDYPLYRAIKKYGKENFIVELIEECYIDELDKKEKYWIDYFDSVAWHNKGYNGTIGGDGCYRKSIQIEPEEIKYYISHKYDVIQISQLMNCGHNTIRRVAHENNIILPNHPHQSKTVKMINLKTGYEQIFYSVRDGAIWISKNGYSNSNSIAGIQGNICKCCNGKRLSAYQHKWVYI